MDRPPAARRWTLRGRPPRSLLLPLAAVLALCLGVGYRLLTTDDTEPTGRPAAQAPSAQPSAAPGAASPVGPQPAAQPVREEGDLAQVCDGRFFPRSPAYRGPAPHPILISVRPRLDDEYRTSRVLHAVAYGGPAARRQAWAPSPGKVQVVACLDLVAVGSKVRSCKSDDPRPAPLTLRVGNYRLTVIEVATGRRLAQTGLVGRSRTCPLVTVYGPDRMLFSEVDDRQLHAALRGWVEG